MLLTIIAIGFIDLVFAVDSIPAIYGLTTRRTSSSPPMPSRSWLRQLYSSSAGLLERLVYLAQGLAVILGFIGVKLVLHALHVNELPFHQWRSGRRVGAGDPDLVLAAVHRLTIAVATAASLIKTRRAPDAVTASTDTTPTITQKEHSERAALSDSSDSDSTSARFIPGAHPTTEEAAR